MKVQGVGMAQINRQHSMSGNVQGFELPRGCLMTTGVILCVIVGLVGAAAYLML